MNKTYSLKIFDLLKNETIYELDISNQELIGRLTSGLYTFVKGHIYYNNNVIKIRYELFDGRDIVPSEDEVFDQYDNVFNLENYQEVNADMPMNAKLGHRFGYNIKDKTKERVKTVMILPYLHDRRIYLNKKKVNTNYFYTSIETNVSDISTYNDNLSKVISKRACIPIIVNKESSIDLPYDSESLEKYKRDPPKTIQSIICIDLLQNNIEVYSQTGILINFFDF